MKRKVYYLDCMGAYRGKTIVLKPGESIEPFPYPYHPPPEAILKKIPSKKWWMKTPDELLERE